MLHENEDEADDGPENLGHHLSVDNIVSLAIGAGVVNTPVVSANIFTDDCTRSVDGIRRPADRRRCDASVL
jgi:hypothetical protein